MVSNRPSPSIAAHGMMVLLNRVCSTIMLQFAASNTGREVIPNHCAVNAAWRVVGAARSNGAVREPGCRVSKGCAEQMVDGFGHQRRNDALRHSLLARVKATLTLHARRLQCG